MAVPDSAALLAGSAHKAERLADLQGQGVIPVNISSLAEILPVYFSDPGFTPPPELQDLHYCPDVEAQTLTALGEFDFRKDHHAHLPRLYPVYREQLPAPARGRGGPGCKARTGDAASARVSGRGTILTAFDVFVGEPISPYVGPGDTMHHCPESSGRRLLF